MKQWLKDFSHNCIVHPMMMFLPKKFAHKLHDRNANWVFGLDRCDKLTLESVRTKPTVEIAVLMERFED